MSGSERETGSHISDVVKEAMKQEGPAGGADFPDTRWSLVVDAQGNGNEGDEALRIQRKALEQLCQQYWYPIYAYVRRRGMSGHDAEDLTQGFFERLLTAERIGQLNRDKGRLRVYLLGAVKNYLAGEYKKATAEKRGGRARIISFEANEAEARYGQESVNLETPESLFELRWALSVIDFTFETLRQMYADAGKEEAFKLLKEHMPLGEARQQYPALAEKLSVTEGNARVMLFRLRQQFRKLLEEQIADTVSDSALVQDEIATLCRVIAKLS